MPQKETNTSQSGNVFIVIFMGIVLFAALSYTISRGMQSETTDKLSAQKAALAAADIINYAQRLERGVNRLRQKNISENDISFESAQDMAYAHSPVVTDNKKLFHLSGGAVTWQKPPQNANDGSNWIFTGRTCIPSLGTGTAGCQSDGLITTEELIAVLPNVAASVCTEINSRLSITTTPADTGGGASATKFTGSFADGTAIILAGGPHPSACFSRAGNNFFYTVLIAR